MISISNRTNFYYKKLGGGGGRECKGVFNKENNYTEKLDLCPCLIFQLVAV